MSSVDWTKSMQQTFEFYKVDPNSWLSVSKLDLVEECSINWDESSDTLGSASLKLSESIDECYIRIYMVINQNGQQFKEVLGTFLFQSSPYSYDGKVISITADGYTPLIELKEKLMSIGFSLKKEEKILERAFDICSNNMRAPVTKYIVEADNEYTKLSSNFISESNETVLSYVSSLIANAKFKFSLDAIGNVMFEPIQDISALQPVWTYTDDDSSILYSDISVNKDLYDIPNVVEVVYTTASGEVLQEVVENSDPNSPISTVSRGRKIMHRETNPNLNGNATEDYIKTYAEELLKKLSSLEYTVSYKHGYCPVRVGDCVRLNYRSAGLENVLAKVTSQSINCKPGCEVSETAVYTLNLWR